MLGGGAYASSNCDISRAAYRAFFPGLRLVARPFAVAVDLLGASRSPSILINLYWLIYIYRPGQLDALIPSHEPSYDVETPVVKHTAVSALSAYNKRCSDITTA